MSYYKITQSLVHRSSCFTKLSSFGKGKEIIVGKKRGNGPNIMYYKSQAKP